MPRERAAAIYGLIGSAKLNGIDRKVSDERNAAHRRSSDQPDRGVAAWKLTQPFLPKQVAEILNHPKWK